MEKRQSFHLKWEKLAAAVAYLTERSRNDDGFGVTKLVKLLYYADCVAYQRTGEPITGANYIRMPHGPYPDKWQGLLERLEGERIIRVLDEDVGNGYQRHRPVRGASTETNTLTEEEKRFLDTQLRRFADFNARQIEEYSHDELAWRTTEQGRTLPYELAGIRIPGPPDAETKARGQRIADAIRERGYRIANDVTPR